MTKFVYHLRNMKSIGCIVLLLLLWGLPQPLFTQTTYDFGFERWEQVRVIENSFELPCPWAGGMNSCHFTELDLNLDGMADLVVFDKHGNRILPFLNNGLIGAISYTFSPEYACLLPPVHDWIICRDYDLDGKNDIFTYADGGGGIKVYRNISDTILQFEVAVEPYLTYQSIVPVNIWLTDADYPVIDDIDGDGDLDILTFGVLGKYLIFYKNLSFENHADYSHFDFIKEDECWGKFFESEASNVLSLNHPCSKSHDRKNEKPAPKHTGSTLLALDMNNDTVKDLIIGDVDYRNLIFLQNGGTKDSAIMISQDTLFPAGAQSFSLFSFPCPSYADVNNDGKKDLIASPFEARINLAENYSSNILYLDSGTSGTPSFRFSGNNRFLQEYMIDVGSGAYPVLYDYNHDGLMDIFIGNYGIRDTSYYRNGFLTSVFHSGITFYKNTGTLTNPQFTLVTRDFAGISALKILGAYPAFTDLDGDNDTDMVAGTARGKIYYFENIAPAGTPSDFVFRDSSFMGISPEEYATPQFLDLDRDGLTDLVCGNKYGKISWYKNTGNPQNPQFTLITNQLGDVNVTNPDVSFYGYSVPCFFEDNAGKYKLFTGTEQGNIFYYKNIENNLNGTFRLVDTLCYKENNRIYDLDEGMYAGVAVYDFNHDGYPDILTGNFSGGLTLYMGIEPPPLHYSVSETVTSNLKISIFPNPAGEYIHIQCSGNSLQAVIHGVVLDITGQTLGSFISQGNYLLKTSGLAKGVYFLSLSYEDNEKEKHFKSIKFIITE